MTQQRISPVNPPFSDEAQSCFNQVMPKGIPPLNIFRTVANNERVLTRLISGGLLDKGSISIAQRELVILRVCANCKAEYEWGVHVAGFAVKAGLNQEQVAATCDAELDEALWSGEQIALLEMADELHQTATLSDQSWNTLKQHFSDEQLIELLMLNGLYHAVSFVVNSAKLEKEAFAPALPVT